MGLLPMKFARPSYAYPSCRSHGTTTRTAGGEQSSEPQSAGSLTSSSSTRRRIHSGMLGASEARILTNDEMEKR